MACFIKMFKQIMLKTVLSQNKYLCIYFFNQNFRMVFLAKLTINSGLCSTNLKKSRWLFCFLIYIFFGFYWKKSDKSLIMGRWRFLQTLINTQCWILIRWRQLCLLVKAAFSHVVNMKTVCIKLLSGKRFSNA